jgi:hypothetical protein
MLLSFHITRPLVDTLQCVGRSNDDRGRVHDRADDNNNGG